MTPKEFQQTIDAREAPAGLSNPLMALWYDAQGDWEKAHDYAQRDNDSESAWVHAYLHRKEDDISNANYWYVRASRTMPDQRLEEEWQFIVQKLLEAPSSTKAF